MDEKKVRAYPVYEQQLEAVLQYWRQQIARGEDLGKVDAMNELIRYGAEQVLPRDVFVRLFPEQKKRATPQATAMAR